MSCRSERHNANWASSQTFIRSLFNACEEAVKVEISLSGSAGRRISFPMAHLAKRTKQEHICNMLRRVFQPHVISETLFRVEVAWVFIGGRNFPAVEALYKSGVIENQAWRVAEDGTYFCIFYFRSEKDANRFVRAFGGVRV